MDDGSVLVDHVGRPVEITDGAEESKTADGPATSGAIERDVAYWYDLNGPENEDVIESQEVALKSTRLAGTGAGGSSAAAGDDDLHGDGVVPNQHAAEQSAPGGALESESSTGGRYVLCVCCRHILPSLVL